MSISIQSEQIPIYMERSRHLGCAVIDTEGAVAHANAFFSRLVGEEDPVGINWQQWFDSFSRERDLPTSHRILAHAEGEHSTRAHWTLPPNFTVELDLNYFALDPGNGDLFGPLFVMVCPVRESVSEGYLRKMVDAARQLQLRQMQSLIKAAIEPIKEISVSLAQLPQNWEGWDSAQRNAELNSMQQALCSAQRILQNCPATALGENVWNPHGLEE